MEPPLTASPAAEQHRARAEPTNPAGQRAVPASPAAGQHRVPAALADAAMRAQHREAAVPAIRRADPVAEPARSVPFRAAARRLFPVVIPVVTMSLEFPISCAVMTARTKGPLGA